MPGAGGACLATTGAERRREKMLDHTFQRRREIERMLLSGKKLTVSELMRRYGVGRKAIRRDFEVIGEELPIVSKQRAALEKTMEKMEKMEQSAQPEAWFDGNKVNDVLFCEDFLAGHPMKCIHGTFFDINGAIGDAEQIKAEIYHKISPYVTSNIAKRATSLLDALRIRSYSPPMPFQTDRIHVANGTYFLSKGFSAQKEFCMNRLPVKYVPDAPEPSRWLAFLGQLLEPEDIATLQEFMGYVLLPTTKGQKMMIVIGRGGEGKESPASAGC